MTYCGIDGLEAEHGERLGLKSDILLMVIVAAVA